MKKFLTLLAALLVVFTFTINTEAEVKEKGFYLGGGVAYAWENFDGWFSKARGVKMQIYGNFQVTPSSLAPAVADRTAPYKSIFNHFSNQQMVYISEPCIVHRSVWITLSNPPKN